MSKKPIPNGSLVLLDTVSLIYFLESHPIYGSVAEVLFQRVEAGDLRAVMSSLVFAELLVPLYRERQDKTASALKHRLLGFRNLTVRDVTPEVAARAARLRAHFRLRTPDALHIATGIHYGCDGILTNDRELCRIDCELQVWLFNDLQG